TVTLDSNGIYSFEFGAGGQSVVSTSELIATTDGSNQVFNATLENLPVDGSVSISDGTYTWSQSNGSSSSTEFTASVTPSSGAVSAIYLGSAPTASTEITVSYSYMDATLSGALSSHASHWLELRVDGIAQSPRERVLSVPFAQVAGTVVKPRTITIPCMAGWVNHDIDVIGLDRRKMESITGNSLNANASFKIPLIIDAYSLSFNAMISSKLDWPRHIQTTISLVGCDSQGLFTTIKTSSSLTDSNENIAVAWEDVNYDWRNYNYFLIVTHAPGYNAIQSATLSFKLK
ncbi:MAG: hypothetical protein VX033_02770, partial [Verrucomicrobiota bacterium]|nr:hypothetical protein [Verrucomicrobiota bacterium]